jgi:hypothetical protein
MSRMYRGPQKMLLCVDDSLMILEFESGYSNNRDTSWWRLTRRGGG